MAFTVTVKSSGQTNGQTFEVEKNESILDAGLRQKIPFPYGCRGGGCGACKGKVVSGNYEYENRPGGLRAEDEAAGYALFCQAIPTSDLVLEANLISPEADIPIRKYGSKLLKINKLASDVMQLRLRLPDSQRLQFLPGQYIDIVLNDGKRRSFSLARAPHDNGLLELHVRRVEDGFYTNYVFETLEEKAIMRIEGPFGTFTVDTESDNPLIMIAGGTGFAPVKSILEHLFAENNSRDIVFYWGARHKESLYMNELVEKWVEKYPNFSYVPVLSEALDEDQWQGRSGFVHDAVSSDINDFSRYDIYACGPPLMIDAAKAEFDKKGLVAGQFYSDAFTFTEEDGSKKTADC